MSASASVLIAGCGSGGKSETADLRAEVAALREQVQATTTTSTTVPSTSSTTTSSTSTTTTSSTTTTTRPIPVTTTTRKVVTPVAAPWCSVTALNSPVSKGMTETLLIRSNLAGQPASVMRTNVTMDPDGGATYTFTNNSGSTLTQSGWIPQTNTATVTFYKQPLTSQQMIDTLAPRPPVLVTCSAKYVSVGVH